MDEEIRDVNDIKELLANEDLPSAVVKIKDFLEQQDRVELNIAITGESGSGKSTFINTIRGLKVDDEGAASTGVVETTMEPTAYPYKKFPNVKLWDLPGIGTPNFKAEEYLQQVEFQRYDFFIIIASDRFRESHANLAAEIVKMEKRFYFVRSKIDNDISSEKEKKTFNEQKTLDAIRKNCIEGLEKIGVKSPVVFLVSGKLSKLALYDFNRLEETIELELPEHKRHVLMLVIPNISLEINERKKKELQKDIWKMALLSAYAAAMPIPLVNAALSISVDVMILVKEFQRYRNAFSVDTGSLEWLAFRSGKSVDEIKAVMKSPLKTEITKDLVIKLLAGSTLVAADTAAEYILGFFPVIGSLAAGALSYGTVYVTLKHCLDELAEDARKVLIVALQTSV